jgi:GTPase SAR1 family protein
MRLFVKPDSEYSKEEIVIFRDICLTNAIILLKGLLCHLHSQHPEMESYSNTENRETAQLLMSLDNEVMLQISKFCTATRIRKIVNLWKTETYLRQFLMTHHFDTNLLNLNESVHFLDHLEEVYDSNSDYYNTLTVLRSKVKTTGIVEREFKMNGFKFKCLDTGGQRNERKKWIHCFNNLSSVFYIVSLAEYALKCYEDDSSNRTQESLTTFSEIVNSYHFKDSTKIVLIFTNTDNFKRYLLQRDMTVAFGDLLPEDLKLSQNAHKNYKPMVYSHFPPSPPNPTNYKLRDLTQILSEDVLQNIFTYLNPRDLARLSLVNREYSRIANSDEVWRFICLLFEPDLTFEAVMELYNRRNHCSEEIYSNFTSLQPYKFYFISGGTIFCKNLEFMVSQFLDRIEDEVMREETRREMIITNCLNIPETSTKLYKVLTTLITPPQN